MTPLQITLSGALQQQMQRIHDSYPEPSIEDIRTVNYLRKACYDFGIDISTANYNAFINGLYEVMTTTTDTAIKYAEALHLTSVDD